MSDILKREKIEASHGTNAENKYEFDDVVCLRMGVLPTFRET